MRALRGFATAIFIAVASGSALALDVPPLTGRIVDDARVLSQSEKITLGGLSESIEKKTGAQVVVLTIKTLKEESLEDFSQKVFEEWKPGQKGKDNGLLLLISINERKIRIQTGYGLEGVIPDAEGWEIIKKTMVPHLKGKSGGSDNYHTAIKEALHRIDKLISGEIKTEHQKKKPEMTEEMLYLVFFLPLLCAVFAHHHFNPFAGGVVGAISFGLTSFFVIGGIIAVILASAIGFTLGLIGHIPNASFSGSSSSRGGGFKGGGGRSGGGGASGSF